MKRVRLFAVWSIVLMLVLSLSGCANEKKRAALPTNEEQIQAFLDKNNTGLQVKEEGKKDNKDADSQEKVFRLMKDDKAVGIIMMMDNDIRLINVSLPGEADEQSEEWDEILADLEKEEWKNIFDFAFDMYGSPEHSSPAYEDMKNYYEQEKKEETKDILFSKQYEDVYFNAYSRFKSQKDSEKDVKNHIAIVLCNEAGNRFFLERIEQYRVS
ncbi:MAG: hypothetical protein Q4D65_01125 [Peptostreptococcaceae bacterium]|nr:hypothetical protein [Peptostreptococcaceae bacterium]